MRAIPSGRLPEEAAPTGKDLPRPFPTPGPGRASFKRGCALHLIPTDVSTGDATTHLGVSRHIGHVVELPKLGEV